MRVLKSIWDVVVALLVLLLLIIVFNAIPIFFGYIAYDTYMRSIAGLEDSMSPYFWDVALVWTTSLAALFFGWFLNKILFQALLPALFKR